MKVRVYFNLHSGLWSIQDYKTRRVIGHASRVNLTDCTFQVSEAGRQRVLRERKKNVHAFVVGTLCGAEWDRSSRIRPATYLVDWCGERDDNLVALLVRETGQRVSYNPYKAGTFMRGDLPAHKARLVTMGATDRGVYAYK